MYRYEKEFDSVQDVFELQVSVTTGSQPPGLAGQTELQLTLATRRSAT